MPRNSLKRSARKSSVKKSSKRSAKKSSPRKRLVKASDCKYKGSEPSPKGRGFCAHNQVPGKVSKGLDGKMWIVAMRNNGSLYWKRK